MVKSSASDWLNMVAVSEVFRDVLDGKRTAEDGRRQLATNVGFATFSNGFYYGKEGVALVS